MKPISVFIDSEKDTLCQVSSYTPSRIRLQIKISVDITDNNKTQELKGV